MSNSKRSLRRHHRERLNKRARNIFLRWTWTNWSECDLVQYVNRRRDNMQMCSCSSCCNNRSKKSWGNDRLTLQELRELDNENDQWNEVDRL